MLKYCALLRAALFRPDTPDWVASLATACSSSLVGGCVTDGHPSNREVAHLLVTHHSSLCSMALVHLPLRRLLRFRTPSLQASSEARSCRIRRGATRRFHRSSPPPWWRLAMLPLTAPKSDDSLFASVDRVNAGSCSLLTYGAIMRQLLTDVEVEEANKQLDQMVTTLEHRLVGEFLAKSNVSRCVDFKETADFIAKLGFKMFMGVTATVTNWDAEFTSCIFVLEDNPLVDFVELPDICQSL